jgi:hypothetical protein
MHGDGPAVASIYGSTITPSRNMSFEATIDEFQHSDRLSKSGTLIALPNGTLLQTSTANAQFPKVSQDTQPPLDNLQKMNSTWQQQPQSSSQTKQQLTPNPHPSALEIPKSLAIALPKSQAPESPTSPKSPQRAKDRRKGPSSSPRTSASSSVSPNPPPRSRRAKSRKAKHSVIEKRYRANLSEKIALLRDCIPGLRNADYNNNEEEASARDTAARGSEASGSLKKVCLSVYLSTF